ncbi:MAG: aldolase catalytic domain-containing protein [Clostridiaceae bacterium]
MGKFRILDCTLRDGGYVNNWEFGYENIIGIKQKLELSGPDVLELGFMRNEPYQPNRAVYNSVDQVTKIIGEKRPDKIYSALIEMANYFPPELLAHRTPEGPDLMRYSFWKRKLDDAYDYCKIIVDKGYKLGVQPTRIEQYTDEEFASVCERFSELNPYAIYIVDTFGLLKKKDLIRYAKIADEYVKPGILIGYHAHNNMQQAFSNATTFVELGLKHDIILDASVYGMGRGAGNLNLEMITNYLNENNGTNYNLKPVFEIWDEYLHEIYNKLPWGYALEYFVAASLECNPNYASYYMDKPGLKIKDVYEIFQSIQGADKYLYSNEKAEYFYNNVRGL